MFRVGILTVSDKGFRGERQDTTHLAIREVLAGGPFEVAAYELVPDEPPMIKKVLRLWADREGLDLILTNGGRGSPPGTGPRRPRGSFWTGRSRASPSSCASWGSGRPPWPPSPEEWRGSGEGP